jgi:tetratricopeptide (TPR) repeat protein
LNLPSDFPAALGGFDDIDLPTVAPQSDLPALAPSRSARADLDLPAAKSPPATSLAPLELDDGLDLPSPRGQTAPSSFDTDLPVVAADLPALKRGPAPKREPPKVDLPAAKREPPKPNVPAFSDLELDLPTVGGALDDLPLVASDLPMVASDLPTVGVPAEPSIRPARPKARAFGEIDLPVISDALPAAVPSDSHLPAVLGYELPSVLSTGQQLPTTVPTLHQLPQLVGTGPQLPTPVPTFQQLPRVVQSGQTVATSSAAAKSKEFDPFGDFGELDLPRELPSDFSPSASLPPVTPNLDFMSPMPEGLGELDFGSVPEASRMTPSSGKLSVPPRSLGSPLADGGLSFGELDLGPASSVARPLDAMDHGTEVPLPMSSAGEGHGSAFGGMEATIPGGAGVRIREYAPRHAPLSGGKKMAVGLVVAAVLGGAALHLTPMGAFAHLAITDAVRSKDYARASTTALEAAHARMASDTYDDANAALEATVAARAKTPRARALTAYAALLDSALVARFGPDPSRPPRSKQWLAELIKDPDTRYLQAALGAQTAVDDTVDKARRALDLASGRDKADPIQLDVALARGELELRAGDGKAALTAFSKASERGAARANFGLARAHARLGDIANAQKEIDATLASSPNHAGARILTASMAADDSLAVVALNEVIDGAARSKASPMELSEAYALRGWVHLKRSSATEARAAFEEALKVNPRNVRALRGQGEVLFQEARYTEALSRFETALSVAPDQVDVVIGTAKTKMALERLADAKAQLTAARTQFPNEMIVPAWLGKVEAQLGNVPIAEENMRAAIALVDPTKPNAIVPYVFLSQLLAAKGKAADAEAALEDARKKLPASAALERAFGQVYEAQGKYAEAVARYRASVEQDTRDLSTRFRLGVVLRRMHRFDEAGAQFDRVEAADKEFPGLALERGLLFEESGNIQKAIDQFRGALAKAPDDLDLLLRIGSAYVVIELPDQAIPMLKKVLEKRPGSAEALHFLGRAFMLKGGANQADAMRNLKRAVELDANRAEYHVYVAWLANEVNPSNLALAESEIEKALALDKNLADAYWQRAVLHRKQGAIEDALQDARRALALRPTRYEAHATIAECLEEKNDVAGAMAEWSKALTAAGQKAHPFWRYRYGKLLLERGNAAEAQRLLAASIEGAERLEPRPAWISQLEFLLAEAYRKTGHNAQALEHYKRFVETAPQGSADLADARKWIQEHTSRP